MAVSISSSSSPSSKEHACVSILRASAVIDEYRQAIMPRTTHLFFISILDIDERAEWFEVITQDKIGRWTAHHRVGEAKAATEEGEQFKNTTVGFIQRRMISQCINYCPDRNAYYIDPYHMRDSLPDYVYRGPSAVASFCLYTDPYRDGGNPLHREHTVPYLESVVGTRAAVYEMLMDPVSARERFDHQHVPAALRSFVFVLTEQDKIDDDVSFWVIHRILMANGILKDNTLQSVIGETGDKGERGLWHDLEIGLMLLRANTSCHRRWDTMIDCKQMGIVPMSLRSAEKEAYDVMEGNLIFGTPISKSLLLKRALDGERPIAEFFGPITRTVYKAPWEVLSRAVGKRAAFIYKGIAHAPYAALFDVVMARHRLVIRTAQNVLTSQEAIDLRLSSAPDYRLRSIGKRAVKVFKNSVHIRGTTSVESVIGALQSMPDCIKRMPDREMENQSRTIFATFFFRAGATPIGVMSYMHDALTKQYASSGGAGSHEFKQAEKEIKELYKSRRWDSTRMNWTCYSMSNMRDKRNRSLCPYVHSAGVHVTQAKQMCAHASGYPQIRFKGPMERAVVVHRIRTAKAARPEAAAAV